MDQDLVRRVQGGDRAAFAELIAADHGRLFRLAHGLLRDPHAAEDATQQAYLQVWLELGALRELTRFESWSYRILVRTCYAETKRRKAIVTVSDPVRLDRPIADAAIVGVVERERLERGFERLSLDHRTLIVMRFLLDLSPEAIAETLDIPRRTVYSRLRRGIRQMRAALEADDRLPAGVPEIPREVAS